MTRSNILVFGDSITYGVGGSNGGWVDKLKLKIHRNIYSGKNSVDSEVHCFGRPGGGSDLLIARLETELKVYGWNRQENIILLSVGVNDSKGVNSSDNIKTPPNEYKQNLINIINTSKLYADKILCIGFTPCDEARTQPKVNPGNGSLSYFSNKRIKQYEDIFGEIAKNNECEFLPTFAKAHSSKWESMLFSDGIHPNDKGYEWLLSEICNKLLAIDWIDENLLK